MYTEFRGRVYSVGDGFCYEGMIIVEKYSKYHFVIDCGSQAPKNKNQKIGKLSNQQECKERLKRISRKIVEQDEHINLLILTHLHVDHCNGVQYLLNKGIPDTIIMPYLYPEERLCLIINNDMDEEELEFMAMPYTRILNLAKEKNPNAKLILIRGNDDSNNEINLDNSTNDESDVWGEPHEYSEEIMRLEDIESPDVQVLHANQKIIKFNDIIWIFKFFNLEADKNDVDVLKKIVGNLTAKDLYENINALKKQYKNIAKKLFNDFNNTSIVTYHAPLQNIYRCGTLITGDINLKHNIADMILKHYENERNKIGLFSVPHHGSDNNWDIKLIDNGFLDDSICFASTHNHYPNRMTAAMMSDFGSHNISTFVVDENEYNEIEQYICGSHHMCVFSRYHEKSITLNCLLNCSLSCSPNCL